MCLAVLGIPPPQSPGSQDNKGETGTSEKGECWWRRGAAAAARATRAPCSQSGPQGDPWAPSVWRPGNRSTCYPVTAEEREGGWDHRGLTISTTQCRSPVQRCLPSTLRRVWEFHLVTSEGMSQPEVSTVQTREVTLHPVLLKHTSHTLIEPTEPKLEVKHRQTLTWEDTPTKTPEAENNQVTRRPWGACFRKGYCWGLLALNMSPYYVIRCRPFLWTRHCTWSGEASRGGSSWCSKAVNRLWEVTVRTQDEMIPVLC